jgi:hypothetical protein
MTKLPSKEFCDKVRTMSDAALVATYRKYNKDFDTLEKERQKCWDRFIEINDIQDVMGGERQMIAIEVRMNRKLKVS